MIVSFATAVLLAQGTVLAAEPEAHPVDLAALETCGDSLDVAIFNSPRYPWSGAPMRVLIVSDRDLGAARVVALAPDGQQREIAAAPYGGPPWGWIAEVPEPDTGTWRFALQSATGLQACQEVVVRRGRFGSDAGEPGEPVWQDRIKWERDTENLYSLWIERLFQAPLEEEVSWNPLAEVLRDPERNLLYGYMGLDEDRDGMKLNPDCADFPYFMRGYFAWKLGLPFTFRPCRRGNAVRAPTCSVNYQSNLEPSEDATRTGAFKSFMRTVKATVHSSSLRSLPEDERSDYYPVALTRRGLRPGTIYTDPYGHTMMISRWYPQEGDRAGVLMAVDAQPDGVIGRRVFWRGSFMFPEDDKLAGAGWKRFRPVRRKGSEPSR